MESKVAERLLGVHTSANMRILALGSVLRSLGGGEDLMCDRFGALLKRRLSSIARRVLREVCPRDLMNLPAWLTVEQIDGEREMNGETKREYELVFCRLDGFSHLLYVTAV